MFYDHFTLLAAVKADAEVTCLHAMHRTSDGLSRYVVIGDAAGDLNFFSTNGQLIYEYQTGKSMHGNGIGLLDTIQSQRNGIDDNPFMHPCRIILIL